MTEESQNEEGRIDLEKYGGEKEHECYECGNKWTRSDGRGCPYGDPTCFLCHKHDHNQCDDPREPCDLCNQHDCERTIDDEEECEYPELG